MKVGEQLSSLIGHIYDATLDPDQRNDVLDKIAKFTAGHSGGLLLQHLLGNSHMLYYYLGAEPERLQAYSESYSKFHLMADVPDGAAQVESPSDLVPYEEFQQGQFYKEWA